MANALLDVMCGVGICGAKPVQRGDDLPGELLGTQRQQVAGRGVIAAGQRDQYPCRIGATVTVPSSATV